MSHEISINGIGQAEAVFGFGEKPWWSKSDFQATVLPDAISFDQVFTLAFPWQAEMEQLQYADGGLSSQHGIRRSDTKAELGVHSGSYGVIQPRDLFDFCAAFFQAYPEIPIASAIAMQGGAVLNLSARIGEIDILGSGDIHKSYLCFVNSFNGRVKAQVYKSYVRPVCMNTTVSGISSADFTMVYKHTKNVREKIARDTDKASQLMMAQQATDSRVQEILEKLAVRHLKKETYVTILDDLFGDSTATKTENIKRDVTALFADNDNDTFPAWKGTAYALFNSITNYVDHDRHVRVTKGRSGMSETQIRAESALVGEGAELKARALERILVLSDGSEACESSPLYSMPPRNVTPTYLPSVDVPQHHSSLYTAYGSSDTSDGVSETGYHEVDWSVPPDTDDSTDAMAVLYTTADSTLDMPGTLTEDIIERISDTVAVRRVMVPSGWKFDAQKQAYAVAQCLAVSQSEWLALKR